MANIDHYISKIVNDGFPELKNITITAKYKKLKNSFMQVEYESETEYIIQIDTSLEGVNKDIMLGGIAHEIAHVFRNVCSNFLGTIISGVMYRISSKYRTRDERETDLLVVERGFGKQLLAFLKYNDKYYYAYTESDGLTVKELKKILAKNNKKKRN